MSTHGIKLALCLGLTRMALFAGNAQAMTAQECGSLPGNQFLVAVERGTCRIDIETAAGPNTTVAENGDDDHNGRNGESGGHHDHGGGNRDGGGNNGAGRAAGKP
jgi:hypothetical protein